MSSTHFIVIPSYINYRYDMILDHCLSVYQVFVECPNTTKMCMNQSDLLVLMHTRLPIQKPSKFIFEQKMKRVNRSKKR